MKLAIWSVDAIWVRSGALMLFFFFFFLFINIEVPENSGHHMHKLGMKLALFLDNLSFGLILC